MTPLPARLAAAWRDTAWRYTVVLAGSNIVSSGVVDSRDLPCVVTEVGTGEVVFRGTSAACRAWIDERCAEAVARVVMEALELPPPTVREAGTAALLAAEPQKWLALDVWGDMLDAWRREMGV